MQELVYGRRLKESGLWQGFDTVSNLRDFTTKLFAVMLFSLLGTAQAESPTASNVELPDFRTVSVQSKVDELFESGEFERAYFIYRNELAPLGDKYAQYMVGYMHLMGMGVEEDEVAASAWYRLAAERGYPEFVAIRKQVLRSLDDEDLQRSDAEYIRLRQQYSDLVLSMRQLRRDYDDLSAPKTGSRLTGRGSPVMIIDPTRRVGMTGESYYRKTELRFRTRLDYVTDTLGIERVTGQVTAKTLRELQAQVKEHVSRVDDR